MAFELTYSLCFLLILLHLLIFTTSQPYQNISLGSSLFAQNDDSVWLSPSEEFAFGFQRIENDSGFLLAIWFNKIPEKTIVWSAIKGHLFQKGSTVELTVDGQFLVNDIETGNQQVISDQSAATGVAYAAMLDTGNLVLANQNSINLWESFRYPTDTILPTQTLSQGDVLFASYTETNYSKGRFQLTLLSDGNLVLYTTNFPLDYRISPYWDFQTKGSGFQVIFNMSGYIFVTDINGSVVCTVAKADKMVPVQDHYQRPTLDFDGVFRHYVYHKSNGSIVETGTSAWSTLSFNPPNICMQLQL